MYSSHFTVAHSWIGKLFKSKPELVYHGYLERHKDSQYRHEDRDGLLKTYNKQVAEPKVIPINSDFKSLSLFPMPSSCTIQDRSYARNKTKNPHPGISPDFEQSLRVICMQLKVI